MNVGKTNAARILDAAGLPYELVSYAVDEEDMSAIRVAEQLGRRVEQIFKTLVLKGDRHGTLVCVIPGGDSLDLKKAAQVSGNKKCAMLPLRDLFATTGYVRGGCSPIGMKKKFPVYVHSSADAFDHIYVNAGQRGLMLRLSGAALLAATEGVKADLTPVCS